MYFKKKFLMIKKEQFNNICPSTMEYCRARGCIFTKNFPMIHLNQVFNPSMSEEKDLSASQLETGSVFTTTGE